jgi:hypothetical protein
MTSFRFRICGKNVAFGFGAEETDRFNTQISLSFSRRDKDEAQTALFKDPVRTAL